jgi:hypothetical protein
MLLTPGGAYDKKIEEVLTTKVFVFESTYDEGNYDSNIFEILSKYKSTCDEGT